MGGKLQIHLALAIVSGVIGVAIAVEPHWVEVMIALLIFAAYWAHKLYRKLCALYRWLLAKRRDQSARERRIVA
jgi:hypothetical protein